MTSAPHNGGAGRRRVLAAVVFADVVNYSAQMAADEAGTHARWMTALDGTLRPKAATHGGVIVKSLGDGVLARFASALAAVEWAEDVQRALADTGAVELRISVHLGDVTLLDDDIYGDGVNVAARLLEHASPGGIVLSETVHELVRGSVTAGAVDIGLRKLKSFDRPMRLFHLAPARLSTALLPAAGAGVLPSIAVLPLANLSDDPRDVYFADGVVEDIIASLAGLGDLLVISRGSTLALRDPSIDPRQVGRLLGVQYVLMGSLRRSAQSIRVRLNLCNAHDGTSIWTESARTTPGELFDMQDSVVAKVVAGIAPNVRAQELRRAMRKRPDSFTAYDHMLRGIHAFHSLEGEEFQSALGCFEAAVAEDPSFAMPFAWIAAWHSMNFGQDRTEDPDVDMRAAEQMAARAIELDANNPVALAIYGHTRSYMFHDYEAGQTYLQRALQTCPSCQPAQLYFACTMAYVGQAPRAILHAQHALRLSPLDRAIYQTHTVLALAHYAAGAYPEAIQWGRLALTENPRFTATHRLLIGSLVAQDQIDAARSLAAEMIQIEPAFSLREYRRRRQPFQDKVVGRLLAERLQTAGLPN